MGASSQPESNENPIKAYEKREDFSFCFRAVPEALEDAMFFQFTIAKQTPPKRKK